MKVEDNLETREWKQEREGNKDNRKRERKREEYTWGKQM